MSDVSRAGQQAGSGQAGIEAAGLSQNFLSREASVLLVIPSGDWVSFIAKHRFELPNLTSIQYVFPGVRIVLYNFFFF